MLSRCCFQRLFTSFTEFESQIEPVAPDPATGRNSITDQSSPSCEEGRIWDQLFIATHNINGLKQNRNKLHHFAEWSNDRNINIIGLSETNLDKKDCRFILPDDSTFEGFWSPRDRKVKGSGVGILVDKSWAKHIGHIDNSDPYFIHLTLFFKGSTFHIVQIYFPPSDQRIQTALTKKIRLLITKYENQPLHRICIMGDFNSITDRLIDKKGPSQPHLFQKKPSALITLLQQRRYIDTFRFARPDQKSYTWHNADRTSASRIDYIWCSPNWHNYIADCRTIEASSLTDSDHEIIVGLFDTSSIIRNHRLSKARQTSHVRTIYLYDQMDEDKWADFVSAIERHPLLRSI